MWVRARRRRVVVRRDGPRCGAPVDRCIAIGRDCPRWIAARWPAGQGCAVVACERPPPCAAGDREVAGVDLGRGGASRSRSRCRRRWGRVSRPHHRTWWTSQSVGGAVHPGYWQCRSRAMTARRCGPVKVRWARPTSSTALSGPNTTREISLSQARRASTEGGTGVPSGYSAGAWASHGDSVPGSPAVGQPRGGVLRAGGARAVGARATGGALAVGLRGRRDLALQALPGHDDRQVRAHGLPATGQALVEHEPGRVDQGVGLALVARAGVVGGRHPGDRAQRGEHRLGVLVVQAPLERHAVAAAGHGQVLPGGRGLVLGLGRGGVDRGAQAGHGLAELVHTLPGGLAHQVGLVHPRIVGGQRLPAVRGRTGRTGPAPGRAPGSPRPSATASAVTGSDSSSARPSSASRRAPDTDDPSARAAHCAKVRSPPACQRPSASTRARHPRSHRANPVGQRAQLTVQPRPGRPIHLVQVQAPAGRPHRRATAQAPAAPRPYPAPRP